MIAFESLYSMDGDFAPMRAICDLAEEFGALTYLDEVHAVGMYGPRGGGVAERDRLMAAHRHRQRHAGQGVRRHGRLHRRLGAVIDAIRSYAPGFIFTTSLPPAVAAGAAASVRHLKADEDIRAPPPGRRRRP